MTRLLALLAAAAWLVLAAPPPAPAAEGAGADAVPAAEAAPAEGGEPDEGQRVEPGAVVHLEFTLWDADGTLLDTSRGRAPLVFTEGQGEIVPGLERALLGMRVGERKR